MHATVCRPAWTDLTMSDNAAQQPRLATTPLRRALPPSPALPVKHRTPLLLRCLAALVAALAAALGCRLGLVHPLSPATALSAMGCLALLAFVKPLWSASAVLTLLPLIGLMPWTGWILVEELDLVVLAIATGGYLRVALLTSSTAAANQSRTGGQNRPHTRPAGVGVRNTSVAWLWLLPLAASAAISLLRGLDDAGALSLSLWQGYREPLNSLRLAKPWLAAALLLPLWLGALRLDGPQARQALGLGFMGLLAGTALGVWWERLAFTGLLNFSSDYRATGAFWEMHVGGAALDALLVAGLPFCTVALVAEKRPLRWAALAALLGLAAYAALVTFSRIVYLAAPVAVGLAWWLQARQSQGQDQPRPWRESAVGVAWVVVNVPVAAWLFPVAGYRGLLAWLGAAFCLLLCAPRLRGLRAPTAAMGALGGLVGVACVVGLVLWVPKGAYLACALACGSTAAAVLAPPSNKTQALALSGLIASFAALVAVSVFWGGDEAWVASLGVALGLLTVLGLAAASPTPAWPQRWPWQALVATGMVAVCAVFAVFSAGAYMGNRMTATSTDTATRTEHWSRSLSWLNTTDWIVGKGLGRYVSNHALSGRLEDQVGDMRLIGVEGSGGGQAAVLSSGKHMMGFGAMYRFSQRVATPSAGKARVTLSSRNDTPVDVVLELCEKHLLYQEHCLVARRTLPKTAGAWQRQVFELDGKAPLTSGWFFAPRMTVFSIGLPQSGQRIEFDNLQLEDATRNSLLRNGDFENGLAHWFTSSDHHHMPWHAKNLAVHLLFEQGYLGLLALLAAAGAALWRVSLGAAQGHRLSPALAGSLVGVLLVGAVDSLLDMPRVAFVVWVLLVACLSLPSLRQRR
jgi:hypothetical protein